MQETAPTEVAGPRSRAQRIRAALPLASAIASTLVLIFPVLSPRLQLYYRDTARLYYPVKLYIAQRLARGELPLWDPWTEAGVSLLGQISPGLFHPFTLLYLAMPFDLAFKLNHLLALPMAAAGAYWLARRLHLEPWPSALAGIVFGCSGYLVSTTASNLPYALGPASIPAACAGLLWLCDRPSAKRLLGASALLALCNYSGEPQSALFAAAIGGPCALGMGLAGAGAPREVLRRAARVAGWTGLWAAAALALSMPAVLPGGLRAHASQRWSGLTELERTLFSIHPLRLPALAIPRAFDDTDEAGKNIGATPYGEYFSIGERASFADAICLGLPAMLFALFAFFAERRGRLLALGGAIFALASCGQALGVNEVLMRLVPGLSLFRYAEKLIGPASLLLALAAAAGAGRALATTKRAAAGFCALASLAALASFAARAWVVSHRSELAGFLMANGHSHASGPAAAFLELLEPALASNALLALTVALVALLRARGLRGSEHAAAIACACAFAAAMTYASDLLFTTNVDQYRSPPELAEELSRRAGPSEGRWRLFSYIENFPTAVPSDLRLNAMVIERATLSPQMESIYGIEGATQYFSLLDGEYSAIFAGAARAANQLLGVRFVVIERHQASERKALESGFQPFGNLWLHELPDRPRAFLVGLVLALSPEHARLALGDATFDATRIGLIEPKDKELIKSDAVHPAPGTASIVRRSPERIELHTDAPGARLLIVSEHFDDGWRATIDGASAPVLRVDNILLGVPVPLGAHDVRLRYWPRGLTAGLWFFSLALALMTASIALAATREGRNSSRR